MSAQRAVRRDDEEKLMKKFLNFKVQQRTNDGGKMKHSANIHDIYTCNLSPLLFPTPRLGMESFNYSSHPFNFFSFSLSSSFVIYHRISSCRRGMMLSYREFLSLNSINNTRTVNGGEICWNLIFSLSFSSSLN